MLTAITWQSQLSVVARGFYGAADQMAAYEAGLQRQVNSLATRLN